ncbi:MAG: hypothetical protein ACXVEF_10020 [Polyangiales bacterium]
MENLSESGERRAFAHAVRGRILEGFKPAVRQIFGEDAVVRIAAHLPDAVRASTLDGPTPNWVPEAHMIAFCTAVDEVLGGGDDEALRRWSASAIDHGFGVARRVLLTIATPSVIVRRSGELWRDEFTSGRLVAFSTQSNEALLTLHESPFTEAVRMRVVVAEAYRRTVELAGANDVAAAYDPESARTLAVTLCWR